MLKVSTIKIKDSYKDSIVERYYCTKITYHKDYNTVSKKDPPIITQDTIKEGSLYDSLPSRYDWIRPNIKRWEMKDDVDDKGNEPTIIMRVHY